jgi:hypothetical protein
VAGATPQFRHFRSISEQFLQTLARVLLSFVRAFALPNAARHVKILAKIRHVFVLNQVSPPLLALFGDRAVVVDAVEANLQIRAALWTGLKASGAARQFVFASAVMAMARHGAGVKHGRGGDNQSGRGEK